MTEFDPPPRAIVAGAGLAGLVAALALVRAGLRVELLDSRAVPPGARSDDGRTTAVLQPGVELLARLGVWAELAPLAVPLARLRLVSLAGDGRNGQNQATADVTFAARELGRPTFGFNVENAAMQRALTAALRASPRAILHAGAIVQDLMVGANSATLICRDGRRFEAALIVAADGQRSTLRDRAGIKVAGGATGQTAIVTRFQHARPHHDTSIELHRRGGPFTLVPLAGRASSLVWVERNGDAAGLLALAPEAFATELGRRVQPWLGTAHDIARPQSFEVANLRAARLTTPRLVLVGEAAHALSPIGAQGFNLSLRDAEALHALGGEAVATGHDAGSAALLRAFARRRGADIRVRSFAVETLGRLVDNDSLPLQRLRSLGLRAIGDLPPLRRAVMHGLMDAVPPLPF